MNFIHWLVHENLMILLPMFLQRTTIVRNWCFIKSILCRLITNYVLWNIQFYQNYFPIITIRFDLVVTKLFFFSSFYSQNVLHLNTRYWNFNNEIGDNSFNFFSDDISTGQILHGNVVIQSRKITFSQIRYSTKMYFL